MKIQHEYQFFLVPISFYINHTLLLLFMIIFTFYVLHVINIVLQVLYAVNNIYKKNHLICFDSLTLLCFLTFEKKNINRQKDIFLVEKWRK